MKFLYLVFIIFFSVSAYADKALIAKIKREGLIVKEFSENLYHLKVKRKKPKNGVEYILVRIISDSEFELLGQGKIQGAKGKTSYLALDEGNVYKRPLPGDYALPIAEGIILDDTDGNTDDTLLGTEDVLDGEKGYIQVAYTLVSGRYDTDSTTLANEFKDVDYFFQGYHLKWYLEFAWRIGLEVNLHGGPVPTETFQREAFDSDRKYADYNFLYRLRKWGNSNFRSVFYAALIQDEFITANPDENLLSTEYQSLGLGTRLNYEWADNLWEKEGFGLKIGSLYLSATYYPLVSAEDIGVSRGEDSSSGFSYDLRAGADLLIYWNKIPYIKRWFVNVDYKLVTYDLNFSGPTVSEKDPFYIIPEDGSSTEKYSDLKILVGFRIEDFIGNFFKPR